MPATVPFSARLVSAGTTIQDYFTTFYTWINANPGNFTVLNAAGTPAISSFTLEHTQGWQINFRVSAGTVLSMIAPNGGITDSAAPGSPTNFSGEHIFLPAPVGTSTICHASRYSDALFFCINSTANTFWVNGFHVGKIYVPDNANDPSDYFIDGLGFMANIPQLNITAAGPTWTSTTAASYVSRIRVAESTWYLLLIESNSLVTGTAPQGDRPAPYTLVAAASSLSSASAQFGRSKYVRRARTNQPNYTILPGATTNQGWLHFNSAAANTNQLMLWDRTVAP